MQLTRNAYQYAKEKHKGQLYGDLDYFNCHIVPVYNMVKNIVNPEVMEIALLHDTIEDTDATYEELRELFGEHVANAVNLLSKAKGADYFEYLEAIKMNEDARIVKIADATVNLSASIEELDYKRARKYIKALDFLTENDQ